MNFNNAMSKNVALPKASSTSPGYDYWCATQMCKHTCTHSHLLQESSRRTLLSL